MALDFSARRRAVDALVLLGLGILLAGPLAAQTIGKSSLTGVTFPLPTSDWNADADGLKTFEIERAATLASRKCAAHEFLTWPAKDLAAANSVRERTDQAFAAAGWTQLLISRTDDGRRISLAVRTGRELVMIWLPANQAIGLLLCAAERLDNRDQAPARLADASVGGAAPPVPVPVAAAPPAPTAPEVKAPPPTGPAAPAPEETVKPISEPQAPVPTLAPREAAIGAGPEVSASEAGPNLLAESIWPRLLGWLVADLLGIGGVVLVVRGLRFRLERGRKGWHVAGGKVLRSMVEERRGKGEDGSAKSMFKPVVVYRYEVEGAALEGSRLRLGETVEASREAAEAVIARYPTNAGIDVHFHPFEPESAVIEIEGRRFDPRPVGGVLLLAAAGSVLFFFG